MSFKKVLIRIWEMPNKIINKVNLQRKHVSCGENLVITGRISLHGSGTIALGQNVTINSKPSVNPTACGTQTFLKAEAPGSITIGNNVGISHSAITSYESITIDDDVLIGSNCMVTDTDFHSVEYDYRMEHPDTHVKSAPVHICKGAFIGARSIILKGVTVGEKSVVAAGSVVTKDVPPSELWGGARLSSLENFERLPKDGTLLITYGNAKYKKAEHANAWTGKHIAGFDEVIELGPEYVDKEFVEAHKDIFSYKRGNGLWLWKPYLIYECLKLMKEGQILFYLDAGAFWVRPAKPLIDIIRREDIFVGELPLLEKQFTKKNVIEHFGTDPESNQIIGTFIGIRKSDKVMEVIEAWLKTCCDVDLIAPDIENEGVDDTYIAHREDQSILSCLCKSEGIKGHKDPTQYGRLPEKYHNGKFIYSPKEYGDGYKPMIAHHRSGDLKVKICLNQWLCCMLPRGISKKMIENR